MKTLLRTSITLLPVIAFALCTAAQAQPYPSKPVRMIAPFPPGGTTDVLARIVAQKLGDALGRQVIVENRPGAGGNLGHEIAAKAPADGYTLVLTSGSAMVTNQFLYKKLNYDPHKDFAPISIVATAASVMVAHPSVPAKSVREFIALAKARPGKLNFGSGGVGTTAHIVGEVFQAGTGLKLVHVPYKGGVLAVTDLVAGQIDVSFSDMVPAVPHIKSGRLRALAVTADRRSPTLPDVPNMAEAGVKTEFPSQWWAVATPRGTPRPVIDRINAEIAQLMKTSEIQERYLAMGIFTAHTTPEQVTELQQSGTRQMALVVKAAGIQPE